MDVIPLQAGITYGPIDSRRLGRSPGINLLPPRLQLCSFDCVCCHYGRTKVKTLIPEGGDLPGVKEIFEAVREAVPGWLCLCN